MYWQTRKSTLIFGSVENEFRSYAECCVDDVTASHAKRNDAIVKFGHSCFTMKQSHLSAFSTGSETYQKLIVYVIQQCGIESSLLESLRTLVLALPEDSIMIYTEECYFECI